MAFIPFAAIRARLRTVLENGGGLVRTVPAGRVEGDYWAGELAGDGLVRTLGPPKYTLIIDDYDRSPASPPEPSSIRLYDVRATLECIYRLPEAVESSEGRDAALSTAEQDGDVIAQALEWGDNLSEATTGIVGGVFRFDGWRRVALDWQSQLLTTQQRYSFIVRVNAPTS